MNCDTVDLDVDYDPNVFLGVPRAYPVEDLENPRDWADETLDEMVEGGDLPFQLRDDLVEIFELIGEHALDMAEDGVTTYIHFPRIDLVPLVLWVEVLEPPSSVRELVDGDESVTVREAKVDEFRTHSLGVGLRILRLIETDGVLNAELRYGWVLGVTAILISTSTDDVTRLVDSLPDLDAFVSSIKLHPSLEEDA